MVAFLTAVLAHEIMALRARLELRNVRSARERILQHLGLIAEAPLIPAWLAVGE